MVEFVVNNARVRGIIFNINGQNSLENSESKLWIMNKDDRFSNLISDHIDNDTMEPRMGIKMFLSVFIF